MCYNNGKSSVLLLLLFFCLNIEAQSNKLSPWLRQIVAESLPTQKKAKVQGTLPTLSETTGGEVCAFVRITNDPSTVLSLYGCQPLTNAGNIYIANIPIRQLSRMASDSRVSRIEAQPLGEALLDSMGIHINTLPAYAGQNLPQAYTGKDIVVGVMDIGFDLSSPNFYTRDLKDYRIKCMWDMLSNDTIGSRLPVGRDYIGQQELLGIQHSRDGHDMTHGTYTLGIAAGSGYDSMYSGVAPESDICIVSNAVGNNKAFIDSANYYKFTDALNALGFKYIFDYAQSVGKPCVASLSEGGSQDFWGESQLYHEMLESLVGPGRIIVAAAGNQGHKKSWLKKEHGIPSKGTFLYAGQTMMVTLKSEDDFGLRMVFYEADRNDTILLSTQQVLDCPDSVFICYPPRTDSLVVQAYPSVYNPKDICYDVIFINKRSIGLHVPLSLEVTGTEADVELWTYNATLTDNELNPQLNAAEPTHNIHSPSAAPCVISVGATTYRWGIVNAKGDSCIFNDGAYGQRAWMSSVGPTTDGRIKPDVMAPGINVISSYSSYYIEAHPDADDNAWNLHYYDFGGRTYAWNCNSGTSAACPAVAGAIALWLQAKPDLTPEEAMGIIARTSRHNDPSITYPNNEYGHGEIDVYRGLLDILSIDRIEEISKQRTPVTISVDRNALLLQFPETLPKEMQTAVYQLDGTKVTQQTIPAGCSKYRIDVPMLHEGSVYAVQIDGYPPFRGSMLVRL